MTYHLITIPKDSCGNQLELFKFDFNQINNQILLGISQDSLNLFQILQIGSTDFKNSWFFGNRIIEDGRMLSILPVLKGWIFLSLFSQCPQSKSVFLTIDNLLSYFYDEEMKNLNMISQIFKANQPEIESFLGKVMPAQVNLEGEMAFRYEEAKISDLIYDLIKDQTIASDEKPSDLEYFELKWSCASDLVIILDNLQSFLPANLFHLLCVKCSLTPVSSEDLNKRLKLTDSMLIKPIKRAGDENVMSPTNDYTKFESKLKPERAKNSKFAVAGNTSMLNFFKKAQ